MLFRILKQRFVALCYVVGWIAFMSPAGAQEDSLDTVKGAQRVSESPIEEIIVTATRREADVQSVPLSVTALTSEYLQELGAKGFTDYVNVVPGLTSIDPGFAGEQHIIRGIRLNPFLPETNPVTALYLDDVPIIGSGIMGNYHADPMLIDVERVEVLRGPQGTLFGASAMGGAIRILTRKPDSSREEIIAETAISTMKDGGLGYEIHGVLNAPLAQGKAAVRAVGYLGYHSGYVNNLNTGEEDVNDRDVTGARVSGVYNFTDTVSITGKIAYQKRESDGTSFENVGLPPRHQESLPERLEDEWINYNLAVDADLGFADLLSSTSYLKRSVDATLDISSFAEAAFGIVTPIWTQVPFKDHELVQELRLTSKNEDRLLWTFGLFYQDFDQDLFQTMPAPGFDELTDGLASAFGLADNLFNGWYTYTLDQIAVYADLSYDLTPRVEVGAGARWYDIERDYTSDLVGLFAGEPFASGKANEQGVVPRFSLSFAATDEMTVFVSAAEGFRWGGINTPEGSNQPECIAELEALGYNGFPISFETDSLWSYDLGVKSRWQDGRLQLNAVVYHIDWSDIQTSKYLDCGVFFVQNAGDATSDGVELELAASLSDELFLDLTAQYGEAELADDVPGLGASAGDRIPGVPRFTGSMGLRYDFDAFGRDVFIRADYQYVGKSYSDFNPGVRRELSAYDVANLRIGLDGERWLLMLFAHNIFDERGIVGLEDSNIRYALTTITPREVGISARWEF